MNYTNFRSGRWLLMAALFGLTVQLALGSEGPTVSGSYQVVKSKDLGPESQVQLRIHLLNHGPSDFSVQRMTLWDSSHPDKRGTNACAVVLRAHSSAETTQQFTIRRSDYQLWRNGFRPRLILQMAGTGRTKSKAVVELDRISGQEAK